jgi:hypothetical protein
MITKKAGFKVCFFCLRLNRACLISISSTYQYNAILNIFQILAVFKRALNSFKTLQHFPLPIAAQPLFNLLSSLILDVMDKKVEEKQVRYILNID